METRILVPGKGEVGAVMSGAPNARGLLLLAHGAGADMLHPHMTQLAEMFKRCGLTTLRFNFPYMQKNVAQNARGGRTDNIETCMATFRAAAQLGLAQCPGLPLFLAGHSFGGRMASHFMAEVDAENYPVKGVVYCSFPLHAAGKVDTRRAAHLSRVQVPQLFLSGDRDKLADQRSLEAVLLPLQQVTLHWLETADHSFKPLKRTRQRQDSVYEEAEETCQVWLNQVLQAR